MKRQILILVLSTLLVQPVLGKRLNAFFSYCTFDQPANGAYIETYLNVAGTSVNLVKNSDNYLQGKIEVQWTYTQNGKIVHFDKYNLLSPPLQDSLQTIHDFIDQQRVQLQDGDYVLELKITDKHSSDQGYVVTQNISIHYPKGKINISDIELLESYTPSLNAGIYTKSGYDLVPLAYNFFPKTTSVLKFYAEIYGAKEVLGDGDFLVSYNISGHQNKKIIHDLVSYKKQKASPVNIILAELPLNDVSSGNYNLSVEIRDKSNQLLASKQVLFQRSNPLEIPVNPDDLSTIKIDNTFVSYITNTDTLSDYISSLYPISSQFEVDVEENQMKLNKLESMQQFFYYFWTKRNPQNPEQAWLDYETEVKSVNAAFSCPARKGYESDRGRVYLEYGHPNSIDKTYFEADYYPYEIWQYNDAKEQRNIKFVFLSRNLSSNCFDLIHSTAKGEYYDTNWQMHLRTESKSNAMFGDIDRGDDFSHRKDKLDDFEHPK
jgi:GWxTD domain-containing protein